ncbi:hypothetical protein, partial [Shewanella algae]|uniref:phenylalanine--tRNA ligase subunit beta-related protein n=1 Tax=Shewanella algae TaxID=38313 RepID=UPI00313A99F0
FVGSIHPKYLLDEKITVDAAIAEIDVETIRATQPRSIKYQPISKQPIAERDFAFLVPDNVSSASVSSEIRKIGGDIVQSVEVFDVFSGT